MKQISLFIIVLGLITCSGNKKTNSDPIQFKLIRDNLYCDQKGNLFLRTVDRSLAEGVTEVEYEKCISDRWLFVVYCDTCKLRYTSKNPEQITNKQPDRMTELRSIVDTATFRLVKISMEENVTVYADINYTYYHHLMLDGGIITLGEKTISTETLAMNKNLSDSTFFKPIYFKKLQKYILKNGKTEKVNISSRSDKPIYFTYHILEIDDIKLTVDKSNRIYFSDKNSLKLGNILLSEDEKKISFEDCDENNKMLIYSAYVEALKLTK